MKKDSTLLLFLSSILLLLLLPIGVSGASDEPFYVSFLNSWVGYVVIGLFITVPLLYIGRTGRNRFGVLGVLFNFARAALKALFKDARTIIVSTIFMLILVLILPAFFTGIANGGPVWGETNFFQYFTENVGIGFPILMDKVLAAMPWN